MLKKLSIAAALVFVGVAAPVNHLTQEKEIKEVAPKTPGCTYEYLETAGYISNCVRQDEDRVYISMEYMRDRHSAWPALLWKMELQRLHPLYDEWYTIAWRTGLLQEENPSHRDMAPTYEKTPMRVKTTLSGWDKKGYFLPHTIYSETFYR